MTSRAKRARCRYSTRCTRGRRAPSSAPPAEGPGFARQNRHTSRRSPSYGEQPRRWPFQIADDVLDVEGSAAAMGKAVSKDAELGKATYPGLLGVEGTEPARRRGRPSTGPSAALAWLPG